MSAIVCASIGCLSSTNGQLSEAAAEKSGSVFTVKINIPEPSGLSFTASKDALLTVSDKTGRIYRIGFNGEVMDRLPFHGHDLEGIEVDKSNGEIWVVEERKQNILHLDINGELIEKISDVHADTKNNAGFEGIAKNGDSLYLLIEKDPGLLIKYNIKTKKLIRIKLNFAKDFSGIDYDISDNTLWIVSDESATLNHCTLDGKLISAQEIDIRQAEGVAVDRQNKVVWIVSDGGHSLHRVNLKD